jgi:hypothetical protein
MAELRYQMKTPKHAAHSEPIRLESIRQFIEGYKAFADERAKEAERRTLLLKAALGTFWPGLQRATEQWQMREQVEAPLFNVFRLLKLQELEKNHSKILANLLNPSGTHGQKTLFLEGFLDLIGCGRLKTEITSASANVTVRTEEWITETGRVDIIVRNVRSFVLVIENKIRSGEAKDADGHTQLQKYWEWLRNRPERETLLVFLTIHGESGSVDEARCISYGREIKGWLEKSLNNVRASRVRETIGQYLETIDDLRNLRQEAANVDE